MHRIVSYSLLPDIGTVHQSVLFPKAAALTANWPSSILAAHSLVLILEALDQFAMTCLICFQLNKSAY